MTKPDYYEGSRPVYEGDSPYFLYGVAVPPPPASARVGRFVVTVPGGLTHAEMCALSVAVQGSVGFMRAGVTGGRRVGWHYEEDPPRSFRDSITTKGGAPCPST